MIVVGEYCFLSANGSFPNFPLLVTTPPKGLASTNDADAPSAGSWHGVGVKIQLVGPETSNFGSRDAVFVSQSPSRGGAVAQEIDDTKSCGSKNSD